MSHTALLTEHDTAAATPCASADNDLWFATSPADVETAKALCGSCALAESCLLGAIERGEPWGVWGGQLVDRGVVIPRKRPMGRPRKADLDRWAREHRDGGLAASA